MKPKDLQHLRRRIKTLEARIAKSEGCSWYHELKAELAAMKRIEKFVEENRNG